MMIEFGDERLPERFWNKVQVAESGCWEWMAFMDHNGYGKYRVDGATRFAHRIAYLQLHGPVPEGLELDHLCRNRACVRVSHLEAVTHRENALRGSATTHGRGAEYCRPGRHRLDSAGVYTLPNGQRQCRECKKQSMRIWQLANRDRINATARNRKEKLNAL